MTSTIVYVIRTQQDRDTLQADHLTPQLSVAFREALRSCGRSPLAVSGSAPESRRFNRFLSGAAVIEQRLVLPRSMV